MKRLLLILSVLPTLTSVAQLFPDNLTPLGFVHSMSNAEVTAGNFISVAGANNFIANGNHMDVTISATSGGNDGIKVSPYDIGGTGASALVDISNKPYLWIKMAGTIGDEFRVNLKNGAGFAFRDGFFTRQVISCSSMSWYKFDFSNVSGSLDEVIEIEIVHNTNVVGAGAFTIDSLILGDAGITPVVPADIRDHVFSANTSDLNWKYANSPNTVSTSAGELQVTISAAAPMFEGLGIQVFKPSPVSTSDKAHFIDISSNPIVKAMIKGTDGDTIRLNLKNGQNDDFVDGFNFMQILNGGAGFKEYLFDFTGTPVGLLDSIKLAELILNPTSQVNGSFSLKALTIGDVSQEICSPSVVTALSDVLELNGVILPNPTINGATLIKGVQGDLKINVYNSVGRMILERSEFSSGEIELDLSSMVSGIYIVQVETSEGVFIEKIVKQ